MFSPPLADVVDETVPITSSSEHPGFTVSLSWISWQCIEDARIDDVLITNINLIGILVRLLHLPKAELNTKYSTKPDRAGGWFDSLRKSPFNQSHIERFSLLNEALFNW